MQPNEYYFTGDPGRPDYLIRLSYDGHEYLLTDFYGRGVGTAVAMKNDNLKHLKTIITERGGGLGALLLYAFASSTDATDVISTGTVALDQQGFYRHMGFAIPPERTKNAEQRYEAVQKELKAAGRDITRDEFVAVMLRTENWYVEKDVLREKAGASATKAWRKLDFAASQDAILGGINQAYMTAKDHYSTLFDHMQSSQLPIDRLHEDEKLGVDGVRQLLVGLTDSADAFAALKDDLDMYLEFISDLPGVAPVRMLLRSQAAEIAGYAEFAANASAPLPAYG
ncbi:hypothetical protein LG634_09075 [Streptomyces bambusae]|uniref:hypothetical protein n=1 Tax=Streptomyces bambusae TaxID=1550616 RepID=UPI001CFF0295|nr:hypothetical protein [Streptomyces bambusae]MCB5164979.1 hypothetical protein [Streptomyces bambusae]